MRSATSGLFHAAIWAPFPRSNCVDMYVRALIETQAVVQHSSLRRSDERLRVKPLQQTISGAALLRQHDWQADRLRKQPPELHPPPQRALEEFVVQGMKTTIPLHQRLVRDEEFLAGDYTKWLEQWLAGTPERSMDARS